VPGSPVSSCHRGEAFEASRWLIDQLKAQVPIWKKEIGPEGEVWLEGDARVPSTPPR
jgi:molybdopterin synthase catalytic subunit